MQQIPEKTNEFKKSGEKKINFNSICTTEAKIKPRESP
jgi:hypothetical protein